nr:rod shape-determining protein RodA [bacterium]
MKAQEREHPHRRWLLIFGEPILPLIIALLCIFSIVSIGASMNKPMVGDEGFFEKIRLLLAPSYVGLQTLWSVLGMGLMLAIGLIDYRLYGKLARWIYWANIAMLVLVLLVGSNQRGTTGWIKLPFLEKILGERTIQPSELAKIALILWLGKQISRYEGGIQSFKQFLPLLCGFGLPFILILLQPDFGTAMVYLSIFVVMLFIGGINWKLMAICAGGVAGAVPLAWFVLFSDTQKLRILTFMGLELDADAAYHLNKSTMAIGSGGLTGKGVFDTGSMGQLNFLPEKHTDFIFSIVGEAFGFIGVVLLIGLYVWLVLHLIRIAMSTQDRFGSLVCVGVVSMEMAHIFENIGMTMGVMPITGIPLPFMSYGGSSMMANMIAMGIIISISRRRPRETVDPKRMDGMLLRIDPFKRQRRLPTIEK